MGYAYEYILGKNFMITDLCTEDCTLGPIFCALTLTLNLLFYIDFKVKVNEYKVKGSGSWPRGK